MLIQKIKNLILKLLKKQKNKKMIGVCATICLIISSIFFIDNVYAFEDMSDYTDLLTKENIEEFMSSHFTDDIDSYLFVAHHFTFNGSYVGRPDYIKGYFFNSDDYLNGKIIFKKGLMNGYMYYSIYSNNNRTYNSYSFTKYLNGSSANFNSFPNISANVSESINISSFKISDGVSSTEAILPFSYLSNIDIYLEDETLIFPQNVFYYPTFTYNVVNNSNDIFDINVSFENFTDDYYFEVSNDVNNDVIETINGPLDNYTFSANYDSIYNLRIFDLNGNQVSMKHIDVHAIYWQQNYDYYVMFHYPDEDTIFYSYYTNESFDDKTCWFGELNNSVYFYNEVVCDSFVSYIYDIVDNKNLMWEIRDSNNTVLYERKLSVVGDLESTYIDLISTTNDDNTIDLEIDVNNYDPSTQYIVYRIDGGREVSVRNNRIINFNHNARIEVFVYSFNNVMVTSAYKDIVVDISILSPTSEFTNLESLLSYFDDFNDSDFLSSMVESFSEPIKFITQTINNFYTNYMPAVLQNFLFFIFGFSVIIIVMRIFM